MVRLLLCGCNNFPRNNNTDYCITHSFHNEETVCSTEEKRKSSVRLVNLWEWVLRKCNSKLLVLMKDLNTLKIKHLDPI